MKTIKLPHVTLLAVPDVPKEATGIRITMGHFLQYKPRSGKEPNIKRLICLPKGKYAILNPAKDFTEQDAEGVVETRFDGYKNYYQEEMGYCYTALESFQSLCRKYNIEPNWLILIEKK